MTFLTPLMLWGALAAAIPVAIHLFFRSRYRTVPWAAMKFLLTAVEQTSRRLKFQELLLLLLRMAMLVMLAIAFARPMLSLVIDGGRGDSVDAVFVFDTSYSMGAQDGAKTRMQRAQEHAITVIDELPAHSTVQIVTCAGKTKTLVGPRSPGNLDQAKHLVQNLELTHLATDLSVGVDLAKEVLSHGQASNKELYVFSDMQQSGFEQQAGNLRSTLGELKQAAAIRFVRCGTRPVRNVAVVGIVPQTGVPRPKARVGFAVLVRNTSDAMVENIDVSLAVDGDEKKNGGSARILKLDKNETTAVTINGLLEKPGLRVLTAKIASDQLEGDNRYDQVILVRDQVNILVVDGNYHETDPMRSSSYYLMHALLLREADQPAKYNARAVPARLATAALLKNQDICILVNCAVQGKPGADALESSFVDALKPFVREGHGLVVISGDNVQAEPYNRILGKKLGLLPTPLKPAVKADKTNPFLVDRRSFASAPAAYWMFKDDPKIYKNFDKIMVLQHLVLDEVAALKEREKLKEGDDPDDNPFSVLLRLNKGQPLAAMHKVGAGEVIFMATAAHPEGWIDPTAFLPKWTDFGTAPEFFPFMYVTMNYLLHTETQTYNRVAGETLTYFPKDKKDHAYYLIHPDRKKIDRLGLPTKTKAGYVVTASDLPRAGVYHMTSLPRGKDTPDALDVKEAVKTGIPIAVIPDLDESKNLATLTNAQINTQLDFTPIHIVAGETASAADRLNSELTAWVLLVVLALVLGEVVLAWWCGRAW
jgi:Aerotolerance regulator N-terminal/von Willebrand factor type A domain